MPEVRVTLTDIEFETLVHILAHAYERALEGNRPSDRSSGQQIAANEPLPSDSLEDGLSTPPTAETIKTIADKLTDAWLN